MSSGSWSHLLHSSVFRQAWPCLGPAPEPSSEKADPISSHPLRTLYQSLPCLLHPWSLSMNYLPLPPPVPLRHRPLSMGLLPFPCTWLLLPRLASTPLPACGKPGVSCSQLPRTTVGGGHSSPVSASQPLLAPSRALFYCLMLRLLPLYLFPPLVGEPLGGRGLCPLKLNSWLQAGLGQFLWKEYINDSLSVVPGPPAAALPGNLPQIQISCPSPDLLSQTPGVGLRFHKPSR